MLAPWKKSYNLPRQHIKKQRHYFTNKCPSSQGYCFSSSHVWMRELDDNESWTQKNWCFWTVLETLEGSLDCGRSNESIVKEISPEYSLERLILKLKLQYFGHLMRRTDLFEKTDSGQDWRQVEKGMAEDKIVGWHHWLNVHEFEQTSGVGDGQGSLACCSR